ncbi:fibronectin type III domain-containing protein [Leptothrix discophora]|uniref:Fibronectin type-III domain-containing protein n=1 Tax=Leptothrix discophora TaxID=89 RepID=A0ABT9G242_LEPDI|nr:hypothetical protein [Leptothrix discophora]MDP4300562.1 hypothetical protein [Leptothrix discophora]
MQRKLIAALVAGALEIYAGSVAAQAVACGTQDGPQYFTVGQRNPVTGYGEYVKDSNNLALQICKDPNLCFFDPQVPGNLVSEQTGTGGESFFWLADSVTTDAVTGFELRFVMAAEATYTTEEPTAGEQLSFTRFRVRMNTDQLGRYTISHPWGKHEVTVETIDAAGWEINETFDIAFVPGQTDACGKVGPWLRWTDVGDPRLLPGEAPASSLPPGFIGDGATPHTVTGGVNGQNVVAIEARALFTDAPVNFVSVNGVPSNRIVNPLFVVQGQQWDGDTQAILASDRITYRRTAGSNDTRIDAFATSDAGSTVTVKDVTTTAATGTAITSPVTLDRDAGVFSTAQGIGARNPTTALPIGMELVAHGVSGTGSAGQATRLVRGLKDSVVIQQADYDPVSGTLTVRATSSDAAVAASRLIIDETATAATGAPLAMAVPPGSVTVNSPAGGSDTAQVRVVDQTALQAPTGATAALQSGAILVSWNDSANEFGYQIDRFVNGSTTATTLPAAIGADVTQFADTGVADDNSYAYKVVAIRGNERAESTLSNAVLVPIVAPTMTSVTAPVGSTTSLVVRWSRTSPSLRSYRVIRVSGSGDTVIGTVAAGAAMQFTDTGLTADTSYTYRVEVVSSSGAFVSSATLSGRTTGAALSLTAPTGLSIAADTAATNAVVVRWTDTANGETGYRVTRNRYAHDLTTGLAVSNTATRTVTGANLQVYNSNTLHIGTNLAGSLPNPGIFKFVLSAVNGTAASPTAETGFHYNGTVPVPGNVNARVNDLTFGNATGAANAGVAEYDVQYCVGSLTTCSGTAGTWRDFKTVPRTGAAASVNYVGLPAGTNTYRFRVRSATPDVVGANSAWVMSANVRSITR